MEDFISLYLIGGLSLALPSFYLGIRQAFNDFSRYDESSGAKTLTLLLGILTGLLLIMTWPLIMLFGIIYTAFEGPVQRKKYIDRKREAKEREKIRRARVLEEFKADTRSQILDLRKIAEDPNNSPEVTDYYLWLASELEKTL